MPAGDEEQRGAVRRRARDLRRRGRAAGAGLWLDHDLLAELRREPFGDEARGQIDVAAGREAMNDGDGALRLRRLGERGRDADSRKPGDGRAACDCGGHEGLRQFGAVATW